jgi:carboxyl-terminal processing protease
VVRAVRRVVPLVLLPLVLLAAALTASPAGAQRAAGLTTVREGYERLLALYVDPLPPDGLLREAWNGAAGAALAAGVTTLPALPPLPPSADGAWTAFASAYLQLERLSAGRIAPADLAYAALDAMAAARKECHTYFMPPDRYAQFRAALEGRAQYVGIGVSLSPGPPFAIAYVFPDSPAERAGLQPGDDIVAVGGVPAAEQTLASLRALITGPEGTVVRLTIRRPGVDDPFDVELVRAVVRIPLLTTALRPDGVAVLRLTTFATDGASERELRAALQDLEAQGARAWVLDLRGNGGGAVRSVLNVLGLFLPEGTTAITQTNRSGAVRTLTASGPPLATQRPLAVLIGPGTASGGEIAAAVLQDTGRARLFGQRTAGCANVGTLVELSDGSGMSITSARLLAGPALRRLDDVGVAPDVEVTAGGGDTVLQAAVGWLVSLISGAGEPAPAGG